MTGRPTTIGRDIRPTDIMATNLLAKDFTTGSIVPTDREEETDRPGPNFSTTATSSLP